MSDALKFLSALSVEDRGILDRFLWTTSGIPSAEGMVRSRLDRPSAVTVRELELSLSLGRMLAKVTSPPTPDQQPD